MKKRNILLTSVAVLTLTGFGMGALQAQDDDRANHGRRGLTEEQMEEFRAEAMARREEQWAEFSAENPELAAELEALRAGRQAEAEMQREEFAEKYPNIAKAREEGRFPMRELRGNGPGRGEFRAGPPAGRGQESTAD